MDWYLQHAFNVLVVVFLIWFDVQHVRYITEAHGEMKVWLNLKHVQVTEAIAELMLLRESFLQTSLRADCLNLVASDRIELVACEM